MASTYGELALPVHEFIKSNDLLRDKFNVQFDTALVEEDLLPNFFGLVKYGQGTFSTKQSSHTLVCDLLDEHELGAVDGALEFAHALLDRVKRNHRHDPPTDINIEDTIRQGKDIEDLYDLLY